MAECVYQDSIRPPLSATGLLQCPVDGRGERSNGVPVDGDDAACIRAVFSHSHESQDLGKYLAIYERGGE